MSFALKFTLIAGMLLSAFTAVEVGRSNEKEAADAIAIELEETTQAVLNRINLYQYGLRGLRGALHAVGASAFNQQQFQRYSQTRDLQLEFPGSRGYGVIRRVPESLKESFLRQMRADVDPQFNVRQLTAHAGDGLIIQFFEPQANKASALGLDIASEPSRLLAAQQAIQLGQARLTAPVNLLYEEPGSQGQQSFLMLLPIYETPQLPATLAEREAQAIGLSFTPLNMKEVLTDLGIHTDGLSLRLYDLDADATQPFYDSSDWTDAVLTLKQVHEVFGRRWQIEVRAHESFISGLHQFPPMTVMLLGALLTLMLCALISMSRTTQQRSQEIVSEQARLAAIVESSSDGIIGKDLNGVVTSWNKGAEQIFGFPAEKAVGQRLAALIVPDTLQDQERDILARVGRGERVAHFETRRLHSSGRLVDVSVAVSPIHDSYGRVVGASKTVRDVSSQKVTQARIQALYADLERQVAERTGELLLAKQQADSANAAKSSFLANMSHEIRTPLNGILGMLQLIRQTPLNFRQNDYASKAQSAARSLLALLNDILDFSKIEAGKLVLEPHTFGLEQMMRELGDVLTGNQGDKNVEVVFDLDPALPSVLLGDSLRLQQVLINLAGNALKFTLQGHVVVSVVELGRRQGHVKLRMSVSDTGIGISHEQQAHIFEGFTQAEASTTRRFGGSGLGLVICKRLVELMEGRLLVQSEPGQGSCFWFDIELGIVQPVALKASCPAAGRDIRVLVAEDNPVAAEVLMRTISSLGWKADLVCDGVQAVARVRDAEQSSQPYDVVLMDWRMPEQDGLTAAMLIHADVQVTHQPVIIMITAYGREILNDQAVLAGSSFINFLTKPLTPQQLGSAVQRALDGDADSSMVAPMGADAGRRLEGLRLLVVEDNELNRQVAAELLTAQGADVQLADGGVQGVQRALTTVPRFDAVIMDVQMPDIDGFEATRRIRAHPDFSDLPILAMTANASPADRAQCLAAGMNEHVAKPIDLDQVVAQLLILTARQARTGLPRLAVDGATASSLTIEAPSSILGRFGSDIRLFQRLLKTFRIDAEKQMSQLASLLEAPDRERTLAVLHALKGSAGSMGASAVHRHIRQLEEHLMTSASAGNSSAFGKQAFDELGRLLALCCEQLQDWADECAGQAPERAVAGVPIPTDYLQQLKALLPGLEARNLRAIDQMEILLAGANGDAPDMLATLSDQVQALDFEGAVLTINRFVAEPVFLSGRDGGQG
ncbi:MAG TPA: CHASE domain-containing protein [Pseudomonas sp.]